MSKKQARLPKMSLLAEMEPVTSKFFCFAHAYRGKSQLSGGQIRPSGNSCTFVNPDSGKAVRIVAREESRELSQKYAPEIENKYSRQLDAHRIMPRMSSSQLKRSK